MACALDLWLSYMNMLRVVYALRYHRVGSGYILAQLLKDDLQHKLVL